MLISLAAVPSWAQEPSPLASPSPGETTNTPQSPGGTPTGDKVIEAAKTKAARSGKRVEIPERHTETTTLYANPDGKTLRLELNTQPVRVKNADGNGFTPIDTTLVHAAGTIKPKATAGSLTLSDGQDKTLLKSQAADATTKIAAPSTLPKPTLKANTATYADTYGKGRDLLVAATPTGFQQKIIIRERPTGPVSFRVPVELPPGMSFKKNAAGRPTIVGKDGKTLTEVRPTLMQDAKAADPNAPLDTGKAGKAAVTLADDGKTLVFTPDTAFLADTATTFPVTVTAAADDWYEEHTGWQKGGMDTWINDVDYQDSWDTQAQPQIVVGKSYASNVAKRWRGYLKFPDIPDTFAGSTVENADLHLWNYQSNACGTSVGSGITARRITSVWDDLTLLWGSQPSVTGTGADNEPGAYSEDCSYAWNLTHSLDEIAQAWVDGEANYGIQLTAGNESELRNWRRYTSHNAGGCMTTPLEDCKFELHPPILTVDFELPITTRSLLAWTESGPRRTTAPSPEEALSLAQGFYTDAPQFGEISDEEALRLETEPGQAHEIGTEVLQPLEGEDWSRPHPDADERAPRVTAVTPARGATGIASSTQVSATFDEPVTGAVISLQESTGAVVPGTVSADESNRTITFAPEQNLKSGVTYRATVRDAADASTNVMDEVPWTFTTEGAAASWTFDEGMGTTAADVSGNGHTATLNQTASWTSGKSGNAVSNVPSQARIAASLSAARQAKAVEVADETTATSITYAQPDGKTFKTEVTAGPVRTRQAGGWVPIDTTLVRQGEKLRPKAITESVAVEFSAGGAGTFVKMSADGKSYALRWPTPLPKPTVTGSVATYADAAGIGADLVLTALPDGFRYEVVLRQRPSKPLELRIGVEDEGLTLSEGKDGRLLLKGKDKKLVAAAAPATVWDGAEGRPAQRGTAAGDLVTKDGRTELVVKPDQAFLTDLATTYPVSVAAAVTLPTLADAWISDYGVVGSSTYRNTTLWVGSYDDGDPAPLVERAYMKFDTAALTNANVSAATLSVRTTDAYGCGDAQSGLKAQRITAAWTDTALTWDTKPDTTTTGEAVATDHPTCAVPGTMSWNLAAMTQAWASGTGNHGILLRGVDETFEGGRPPYNRAFESFNGTNKPTLNVTYTLGSTPTISALQISPATSTGGTVTATSLTPQLAATVADTAGGNLTGQFEVEHDPAATGQGSGQIWAGASPAVASGGQAAVNVPAGRLADGWKIRWRARAANAATSSTSTWSDWQTATVDVPNPTVSAFQVTPSQVVNGVTVATSLTPALQATVTDPAAQPLRAEFELEHDPAATGQGTGQIWAGAVDNVASGTQASATVPDGKLTDGWKARWRVRAVNTASSPWSNWQNLTIDVPDAVSEPAVGALQVSPSEQVDGGTVTPTRTPALLVQVSDPAGKPLRAEAEIEHDPAATGQGTGQIWAGNADNVPAGTQASITVPADTLTDGWKVRWRARAISATAASAWSDWQTFTISLPKPTATGLAITPSKVVDGVTVTTTLTPALQATLTHPTGWPLRAEAEIEHDPAATGQGTGQIWAGSADNVASGTQASVPVPAGRLTDGLKVRWRLRAATDQSASAWSDWQQVTVDVTQPGEEPLAQTAEPVIRTDQSFSVAAWLRWDDKEGDYSVIEQRGAHQAPFRLGNTRDHGLIFTLSSADTANAVHEGVLSSVEPPVNEWFHLAGIYDAAAGTASLYLNGQLVQTAPISFSAWDSPTRMLLGAVMRGGVDNARVYQKALGAGEVSGLLTMQAAAKSPEASARTVTPQALPAFDYERISLQKCEDERDARAGNSNANADGWDKVVTYTSCWSRHLLFAIYEETEKHDPKCNCKVKDKKIDDFLNLDFTVVMHSYQGNATGGVVGGGSMLPRNIKVWTRVDNFWSDGNFLEELIGGDGIDDEALNKTLSLQLKVTGGSTACSVVASNADNSGASRTARVEKWVDNGDNEFTIRSMDGDVSRCTIEPWLTYDNPKDPGSRDRQTLPGWGHPAWVDADPERLRETAPRVRCDNIPMGGAVEYYKGGCIFSAAKRVLVLNSWNYDYGQVARHIQTAFTKPSTTVPFKTDGPKHIPGNRNAGERTPEREPLTRILSSSSRYSQNRTAKDKVCKEFFSDRPLESNGAPEDEWQECDEYPFASTKEGGAYDHPEYGKNNFSVQAVLGRHNSIAGSDLGVFFGRYRVLNGNKFWVAVR